MVATLPSPMQAVSAAVASTSVGTLNNGTGTESLNRISTLRQTGCPLTATFAHGSATQCVEQPVNRRQLLPGWQSDCHAGAAGRRAAQRQFATIVFDQLSTDGQPDALLAVDAANWPKDFLAARAETIEFEDYIFEGFPTVLWDLEGKRGHPIRTTVSEMGPLLLSRLFDLNDTQEGVLNIAFRIADEQGLLLLFTTLLTTAPVTVSVTTSFTHLKLLQETANW